MSRQNLTIYLGSGKLRDERLAALDRLAGAYVPDSAITRKGSERSVLFQVLADHEKAAAAALEFFLDLIGQGNGDPPPNVVLWNGRMWEIKATPLES